MAEFDLQQADDEAPRRDWRPFVPLAALAFLVLELTLEPAWAAVTLSLGFGWDDFRNGLYVRGRDPRRGRGWATMFAYWALSWARTAFGAFVLTIACALALQGNRRGNAPLPGPMNAAAMTAAIALLLFLALSVAWVGSAALAGCRVWLNSSALKLARRAEQWPPRGRRSSAALIVGIPGLGVCAFMVGVIAMEACWPIGNGRNANADWRTAILLAAMVLVPIAAGALVLRHVAEHDFQAYPELLDAADAGNGHSA